MFSVRFLANAALCASILPGVVAPQSNPTGSISGRVISEQGQTLRAAITLSFTAPRGYPASPRRGFTGTDGSFVFSHLEPGRYALCAQVSASEGAPANSPYVDTCVWGSGQAPITLTAGQQIAGIVFTAVKGAWLQVRVVDPDHVLPQAVSKAPSPLEPEFQLMLKGPDGLYRHARFVSSDGAGRNYLIAVPLKIALSLKVTSSVGNLFDQTGNQVQEKDAAAVQPSTPADLGLMTYTVRRK